MTSKEEVKRIAKLINPMYSQIVIDLFQENLDDLIDKEDVTPDDIGSLRYNLGILIEVFNPCLEDDINLLLALNKSLDDWCNDREFVNKTLGLDPNE